MRRTIIAIAVALAVVGGTGQSATADLSRVTGGDVSVEDTLAAADTCIDVPVKYDFTGIDASWHWTLNLESTSAFGAYGTGEGGNTGAESAMW